MNHEITTIKRALISVANKTGLIDFARQLIQLNIEIISTGGTSQALREANIPVHDVAEVTEFPEMMDGRLKTLHPKIHGGILGMRDQHAEVAKAHHIAWIDLVVVNLYPFAETIKNPNVTLDQAIDNIDIGGPTMLRSAAKNMSWVGVIVDPMDYPTILTELTEQKGLSFATRQTLATKAFTHTANYDHLIAQYLLQKTQQQAIFPEQLHLHLEKFTELRYGENPHQAASAYQFFKQPGILSAKQHQGKQLSYNNITDADAAIACVREFTQPACVIVKHMNPCGVAIADDILTAFQQAFKADSLSAFGGVVALNQTCDKETAEVMVELFLEVLIAPHYTAEALAILAKKSQLRVLEMNMAQTDMLPRHELKFIMGGVLIQEKDHSLVEEQELKIVTHLQPTDAEIATMLFAWPILKHIKSNAILIAKNTTTVGIGAGQVSRVDAVDIAIKKAGANLSGSILASDAFFPFRDSIDRVADTGICAIIQPGGSIRDAEVIAACNEHHIAMVFTGKRCFKH